MAESESGAEDTIVDCGLGCDYIKIRIPGVMGAREALEQIPAGDFLRVTGDTRAQLPRDKKIALIRKGNELFNRGEFELAKRIFLTTGYSDGLVRLGELYEKQKRPLEAFRMYHAAPYKRRTNEMVEQMAAIVQKWLHQAD